MRPGQTGETEGAGGENPRPGSHARRWRRTFIWSMIISAGIAAFVFVYLDWATLEAGSEFAGLAAIVSLMTSLASLVGTIVTTVIAIRAERRAQRRHEHDMNQ